eukprot:6386914-Prymnesium_polylepis.1
MPKRKPERAVLDEAYGLEKILRYRGPPDAREYLGAWDGFSTTGDTWEPKPHIYPTKLITHSASVSTCKFRFDAMASEG